MGQVLFSNVENTFLNLFSTNAKANSKTSITKLVLFCLLLFTSSNYYAQKVAPLGLSNVWIYDNIAYRLRISIVDTNYIVDSISYCRQQFESTFTYSINVRLKNDGYYAVRLDTSYSAPNHEQLYYKKNAVVGDIWINPAEDFPLVYTLVDTFRQNIYGQMVTIKHLEIDGSLVFFHEYWTEEFGVLSRSSVVNTIYFLRGCIIDGVVYGDTSLPVAIENDIEPSNDFTLEQNYPNPFNPATTIKYSIPTAGNVQLFVYNTLGEVVSELVNEWQPTGYYSVGFSASNLSGGVYFYRLKYGAKLLSKKMMLLK